MTAAATRKLTKDIENVLKKVNEGLDEFSECWDLAVSAGGGPQKEKLGEELKKSINKLQRLRAQIREWIGQAGVPNGLKDKLEEARRKIESDMQRFKEFERELKTKAFSSSALARTDELELEEAEKVKYQDWLAQTIQTLKDQLDLFEADIESLEKKKSLGNDEKSRLAQLKELQERHRWHIRKLEQLLRAVDNDAVEVSDLAVVRDSIEIYVESCEEPDCYHDETLYDGFDLTEFEEKAAPPRTPTADASKECGTPASSKEEPQRRNKDKEKRRKEDKKEKKKEDKKAGTTANPAGSPVVSKAGVVRNPPEVKTMLEATGAAVKKTDSRERLDTDEVKVQEDQLLGEAEEFICKICQIHVVGCSPKLTSCSHLFCGDCIAQWFAQHPESQTWAQRAKAAGPERVVPCPVCKQPLNEKRDLYPVCGVTSRSENLLLWRMLSSLKIMCSNHPKVRSDGKCDWIGEYGSYQKHAERCKNLPMAESGFVESENTTPAQTPQLKPSPQVPPVTVAPLPANAAAPPQRAPAAAASPKQAPAAAPAAPAPMAASPAAVGAPAAQGAIGAAPSPAPASPAPAAAPAVPARSQAQPAPKAVAPKAAAPTVSAAQAVAAAQALQGAPRATPAAAPAATAATAPSTSPASSTRGGSAPGVAPRRPTSEEQGLPQQAQPQQRRQEQTQASASESSFVAPAMSAFEPSGSNMVRVHAGDLIQVLEQHGSGWTYAKNLSLAGASAAGWIPSWIVQAPTSSPEAAQKTKAAEPAAQQQPAAEAATATGASAAGYGSASATTSPAAKTSSTASSAQQQAQQQPARAQESPSSEAGRNVVRATAPFSATSSSQLTLLVSDMVEVVERHGSGWTYGRKASDAAGGVPAEGWFPDWAVATQKSS
eukprot:TRINITY_DN7015_c0_g2_i1.p1 TRINITY_DN7015_c0_g2~~TRINITY_DN7015_c0_g2_i1.p1  ORF type:complete len:886 (+),score=201.87 TRINITY_DN7015_c0_g2_i1:100-2757(+)